VNSSNESVISSLAYPILDTNYLLGVFINTNFYLQLGTSFLNLTGKSTLKRAFPEAYEIIHSFICCGSSSVFIFMAESTINLPVDGQTFFVGYCGW
jgi:hypothetical protein